MKALCALSSLPRCCATGLRRTRPDRRIRNDAQFLLPSPMIPAVARRGTPCMTGRTLPSPPPWPGSTRTLRSAPSTDSRGFGFRLIKLADGKIGYVEDSNLSTERAAPAGRSSQGGGWSPARELCFRLSACCLHVKRFLEIRGGSDAHTDCMLCWPRPWWVAAPAAAARAIATRPRRPSA